MTLFFLLLNFLNDTLSTAYSDKWKAAEAQPQNDLVGLLSSHDLAFVVFGVVLLILFTLFIFLYRLDNKLSKVEEKLNIK
jgi:hypothetical protein